MFTRLWSLVTPPLCVACGADAGRAAPLCRGCRAGMDGGAGHRIRISGAGSPHAVDCWAAFPYDGPAGALVRALKFGGRAPLAGAMAAQLAAHAPPGVLRGVVVPVPVHPRHRRRRGLDHAHALAAALARRARLELADCLVRVGDPTPQVGRGRRARMRGPAGSVVLSNDYAPPSEVVIVDDVVTTGATIAACADALAGAGATRICAVAYARTTAR